jgi:hypothetical protein
MADLEESLLCYALDGDEPGADETKVRTRSIFARAVNQHYHQTRTSLELVKNEQR